MFLLILFAILATVAAVQLALRRRLRPWLPGRARRGFDVLALLFVLVPLLLFMLRRNGIHLPASRIRGFLIAFTLWQLSSMMLLAALAAGRLGDGLLRWRRRDREDPAADRPRDPERRRLVGAGVALAAASAVGTSGWLIRRTEEPERVELRVPVKGLPPALAGLVLVQLSDLHAGIFMSQRRLERHFAQVNELAPDLVVLTGDLIDNSPVYVPPFQRATRVLRPRLGTVAVLGNHDFYTGPKVVTDGLRAADLHVLRNQHLLIGADRTLRRSFAPGTAAGLVLGGIDDPVGRWYEGSRGADLARTFEGAPGGVPRLLLSHRPDQFVDASAAQVALTLSGHTHGGQLILPLVGSAARLITRFPTGVYEMAGSRLYVNRGLGVVGLPVRLNCPAELTRIVLVPA